MLPSLPWGRRRGVCAQGLPTPSPTHSDSAAGALQVVASVAKHFKISQAAAALRYADFPQKEEANHCPLGQGCSHRFEGGAGSAGCGCEPAARFTILNQGVWQHFAEAHGNGAALEAMVVASRSVCYRDVLGLLHTPGQPGGKLLVLRPRLFEIIEGPRPVNPADPRLAQPAAVLDCVTPLAVTPAGLQSSAAGTVVYEVEGRLLKLPAPADTTLKKSAVAELVINALAGAVGPPPDSPQHLLCSTMCCAYFHRSPFSLLGVWVLSGGPGCPERR